MKRYDLGLHTSKYERIFGWIYLPFHMLLLSFLLSRVFHILGWPTDGIRINAFYFCISFVFILLIFHRFLWNSLCGIMKKFWAFVQALILGFVLYYAAMALLGLLYRWLFPGFANPNDTSVSTLASMHYGAMIVFAIALAPIIEETLMRGLIFGSIQRKSRVWAYAVSFLAFAAIHTWQYFGAVDLGTIVLAAIQYLPAGIALGWTYEKAGNIWAPILLHMAVNAISMGLTGFSIG